MVVVHAVSSSAAPIAASHCAPAPDMPALRVRSVDRADAVLTATDVHLLGEFGEYGSS